VERLDLRSGLEVSAVAMMGQAEPHPRAEEGTTTELAVTGNIDSGGEQQPCDAPGIDENGEDTQKFVNPFEAEAEPESPPATIPKPETRRQHRLELLQSLLPHESRKMLEELRSDGHHKLSHGESSRLKVPHVHEIRTLVDQHVHKADSLQWFEDCKTGVITPESVTPCAPCNLPSFRCKCLYYWK
jgi:hypothetical protein